MELPPLIVGTTVSGSTVAEYGAQTGKTLQLFRGHTAPVTSLAFVDRIPGSGKGDLLVTGSWDKVPELLARVRSTTDSNDNRRSKSGMLR